MKKILLMLVVIFAFQSNAFAAEDFSKGFRGIAWGTDIKEVQSEMFLVKPNGVKLNDGKKTDNYQYYVRKGEVLQIGDVTLTKIEYCFWKNKLYSVIIKTSGRNDYNSLLDYFRKDVGDLKQYKETNTYFLYKKNIEY